MVPKRNSCAILALFLFLFSACSTIPYLPVRQAIPLVEQKNDLMVEGSLSIINPFTGLLLKGNQSSLSSNLTYGLSNALALHLSGSSTMRSVGGRREFLLGLGYYKKGDRGKMFHIYLLASKGISESEGDFWFSNKDIRVTTYSIRLQPQFSHRQREDFVMTVVSTIKRNSYRIPEDNMPQNNQLFSEYRIEPAIKFSTRKTYVNMNIELGTSFNFSGEGFNLSEGILYAYGAIGVSYCITCKH